MAAAAGLGPYADAMKGSYLGPRFSAEEIARFLDTRRVPAERFAGGVGRRKAEVAVFPKVGPERAEARCDADAGLHELRDAALDGEVELGCDAVFAGDVFQPERVSEREDALRAVVAVEPLRVEAAGKVEVCGRGARGGGMRYRRPPP
jgi:hypothetical protein